MRVCARIANRVLTGDERGDLLGRLVVRVREQVRVCLQDRFGPVAEPSCDDVQRDTVGQQERRGRVPEDVQRPVRTPAALRWRPNHSVNRRGWIGPPSGSQKTRSWSTYASPANARSSSCASR
jgi:hypothetical protein